MAVIERELFTDTWTEYAIAGADLEDQWAERVLLGSGGGDLEDTWREIPGPALADVLDQWAEFSVLRGDLMDWWRETGDLLDLFSDDVQRPVGRVEEE